MSRLVDALSATCRTQTPDRQIVLLEQLIKLVQSQQTPPSAGDGLQSPQSSSPGKSSPSVVIVKTEKLDLTSHNSLMDSPHSQDFL